MSTVPAETPVTKPPDTVALLLLALHTPPDVELVSDIVDPMQTAEGPAIVPALAAGRTAR